MKTCTYPVGTAEEPCRKVASVEYVKGKEDYYRCFIHDGRTVREWADDHGFERREIKK